MKEFMQPEILELKEEGFDKFIIGNRLRFETCSKDSDKEQSFEALVLDLKLSNEGRPFSLNIIIEGETEEKELYIVNIKSIKPIA